MKRTAIGTPLAAALLAGCAGDAIMIAPDLGGGGADQQPPALVLAPGEVVELVPAGGSVGARLATPAGDERFVAIVASHRFDGAGDAAGYEVTVEGAPTAMPVVQRRTGCSIDEAAWRDAPLPAAMPPSGTPPEVGTRRELTIGVRGAPQTFAAQVAAVGRSAVVWVDVSQDHPANLDPGVMQDFLREFDDLILPRERTLFGVESDVDGDGRIGLVFTPLTYQTAVAFFTGCDLLRLAGCASSNGGEYLYLTPPSAIPPPYNTPAAIKETLAHELAHLIHFNRKVLRNQLDRWDDSAYFIEGVGAFAQDASGWQAGNLYVTLAGLDGLDEFSLGDTLADGVAYDAARDGLLRGGSYLFTRFLYDRAGGDDAKADGTIASTGGPALLRALLDDAETMATALPAATRSPLADVALDFYTALAMSNREAIGDAKAENPCFRFRPVVTDPRTDKPRGADLFARFHGMRMNGPPIQGAAEADGLLLAGGVELLLLEARAGEPELPFTITVAEDEPVRVRIGRIH